MALGIGERLFPLLQEGLVRQQAGRVGRLHACADRQFPRPGGPAASDDELTLDQLFFLRPAAGWADYRTPIRNYWQCGSGTHPGGGITAGPGRLAAREILGGKL